MPNDGISNVVSFHQQLVSFDYRYLTMKRHYAHLSSGRVEFKYMPQRGENLTPDLPGEPLTKPIQVTIQVVHEVIEDTFTHLTRSFTHGAHQGGSSLVSSPPCTH